MTPLELALAALCIIAAGLLVLSFAALVLACKHQPQARVHASRTWSTGQERVEVGYEGPDPAGWTRAALPSSRS